MSRNDSARQVWSFLFEPLQFWPTEKSIITAPMSLNDLGGLLKARDIKMNGFDDHQEANIRILFSWLIVMIQILLIHKDTTSCLIRLCKWYIISVWPIWMLCAPEPGRSSLLELHLLLGQESKCLIVQIGKYQLPKAQLSLLVCREQPCPYLSYL